MAEENQLSPLAPAGVYHKSDEESARYKPDVSRQKRSSKCLVYTLAGIVILGTIILVFALIFMRASTPDVKLRSVTVENLRYDGAPSASLNVTLIAEVTVKNTNFGNFRFKNSTASVLYEEIKVAEMIIREGVVKSRETKRMNFTVEVRSDGLSDNKNFSSDINSTMVLKLRSYAELTGRVHLIKTIKKRKTAVMNCTMDLDLNSSSIQDLLCF